MPKAYAILTEAINDPSAMAEYGKAAAQSITGSGGTILAVDRTPHVLEGNWHGNQTVVLEFESVEAARAWYESDAYQKAIPLRRAAADCNAAIIAGMQ
jgi:uncharacterized protein (DUF1330 family)